MRSPTRPGLFVFLTFLAAVAACTEQHTAGSGATGLAVEWSEPVEVASGPAFRGPWRMNDSEFFYVDDPAAVLTDEGGYVAWVDNQAQDVFIRSFDADGSLPNHEPVNVSSSPDTFSWLPRLAVSRDQQTLVVVWQEIAFTGGSHGGEILVARSTDGGRSFSEPLNLSNTTAGAGKGRLTPQSWDNGSLDVVFGADDRLYVAWTEYEGALRATWSDDLGESFAEPIHVAGDDADPARGPSIAAGSDGRVWLAWTVGDDDQADIHLARSRNIEQGFSEATAVHSSDENADAPVIAVDPDGRLHLAYTLDAGGRFRDSRIVHSFSDSPDADFSRPTTVSRFSDVPDAVAAYPQLAVTEQAVVVSWEHARQSRHRPVGIGFAVSLDGGESFAPPAIVPGSDGLDYGRNAGNQGLLMRKLDADHSGRVILGHSTFLDGEHSHIRLFRGRIGDGS